MSCAQPFWLSDIAYTLLMQETYPSWLYPVKMGATTIWERWDGQKPDSTFQSAGMNSFNHYAYGAIGDWMYSVIAGVETGTGTDGVGYKKIIIRPHVTGKIIKAGDDATSWAGVRSLESGLQSGGSLKNVAADLQTYYGKVSSHWKIENDHLTLDVEIPPNTTATIYLPGGKVNSMKESGILISNIKSNFKIKEKTKDYIAVEVGSGKYSFTL